MTTTEYESDSFGRLKLVILPSTDEVEYTLDWRGRRVEKYDSTVLAKRYIYESDLQLAGEIDIITGDFSEFVYSDLSTSPEYMIKGTDKYRFVKDQLGSIRLVVNATNGAIVQRMDYNEWGKVLADTNPGFQPFGFAGGLYESQSGLVRFGARDYDAEVGRWTSKDPILFEGGDTNLFVYVLNDPVNLIDSTGLYWFRQVWQTPGEVGRVGSIVPPAPEGQISNFIERYVPAGYTFGQNHDGFVDWATSKGVPDWLANIPSMIPLFGYSVGQEVLRSMEIISQPTPSNGWMCK